MAGDTILIVEDEAKIASLMSDYLDKIGGYQTHWVDRGDEALKAFEEKVNNGEQGVEEDLMFHLKIAEATHNSVLNSLQLLILAYSQSATLPVI